MPKGESSREKTKLEIQKFLYNNKTATTKEMLENTSCSKATFYKYLDELVDLGKLICIPKRETGKSLFRLSKKTRREVGKTIEKQAIYDKIDRLYQPIDHCFKCGEPINKENKYCGKCGTLLDKLEAQRQEKRQRLIDYLVKLHMDEQAEKGSF